MTTRRSDYHTAYRSAIADPQMQTFRDFVPRPVTTSLERKNTPKRNLVQEHGEIEEVPEVNNGTPDTPRTRQRQLLAEAISTAMSKGLEPLLAVKESKNKPTKYRGAKDGNADGWMTVMKRHLEKAHTSATPLDKALTIIEYLEHEAKDYITNKSEAERDTDEKVFALLARRIGTGSRKIHIQQQFRTHVRARTECGSTTHSGGSPLHRPALSAHAWLLLFGQLSDGSSTAPTDQPSTEPIPGSSTAATHRTS